jgi:hypothetical protein
MKKAYRWVIPLVTIIALGLSLVPENDWFKNPYVKAHQKIFIHDKTSANEQAPRPYSTVYFSRTSTISTDGSAPARATLCSLENNHSTGTCHIKKKNQ